jgi:hypothetical protein
MHIDPLEKKWAYAAVGIAGLFVGIILIDALFHGINHCRFLQSNWL